MSLKPGTRLGQYEILSPLGAGGMGEVWRAKDSRLGREVAIKVLPEELPADRERVARFEREARAASSLNHPNIVTIHEVGEADGRAYLVMERVDGQTLRELLQEAPLPPRRLLSVAAQTADGNLVAFVDHPLNGDDTGSIIVADRAGKKRVLSEPWSSVQEIAWSPDGKEIWFTASPSSIVRSLRSVTLSGKSRLMANAVGTLHDLSPDGRALISRDAIRSRLLYLPPGETRESDLTWLDSSIAAALSSDGTTVLFAEEGEGGGGAGAVYLRKSDGSPPVRLGEGYALDLSPDKKWALSTPINFSELYLLPTGVGQARKLERGGIESYQDARFLPDSKRIVFGGRERGHQRRLYIQDSEGGGPRPITPEGAGSALKANIVSPDGRFVTGPGLEGGFFLYPVDGGSPVPIRAWKKERCRSSGRPTAAHSMSIGPPSRCRGFRSSIYRLAAGPPGRISCPSTPRDRAWS